jgi:hypothetical protein
MKKLIIPAMLETGLMLAQTTPPAQDQGQGAQTKTTKKAKKSKKNKKDQTSTDSTTNK